MTGDNDHSGAHGRVAQKGKLIDLRDHRAAEQALDHLFSSNPEPSIHALRLADALSNGPPLLAAVIRRLDASQPRTLETLGYVVSHYPDRSEAISALMRAAHDRRNSDSRRLGAMMLLEHFLNVIPPGHFVSTLRDPARIAISSLLNVLEDSADPTLLYDYLRDLILQPPELLYSILNILAEVDSPRAVDVLQLLALQPDPELRLGAIEALVAGASPRAIHVLNALERNLPPDSARVVSRAIQKLRLSGIEVESKSVTAHKCRALLSQIDGRGDRLLWLIVPASEGAAGQVGFLGLVINDIEGVEEAVGAPACAKELFPPYSSKGKLRSRIGIALGDLLLNGPLSDPTFVCVEAPFHYGLKLLAEAVQHNWASGTMLPVEYQLLNGLVWDYYICSDETAPGETETDNSNSQPDDESDLLSLPLFAGWYVDSEGIRQTAREVANLGGSLPHQLSDENWRLLLPALIRLAHEEFSTELRARYSRRLGLMAEWLRFTGQNREAALAASASRTILKSPPEANLFVLRLVQRGILVALNGLLTAR